MLGPMSTTFIQANGDLSAQSKSIHTPSTGGNFISQTNNHQLFYRSLQTGEAHIVPMNYVHRASKAFAEFRNKIRVLCPAEAHFRKRRIPRLMVSARKKRGEPESSSEVEMRQPRHIILKF